MTDLKLCHQRTNIDWYARRSAQGGISLKVNFQILIGTRAGARREV